MEDAGPLLWLWLGHAGLALPIVLLSVFLTRRSVSWHWWEASVFVVPFGVWFLLLSADVQPKSLANAAECFLISAAIAVAAPVRAWLGRSTKAVALPVLSIASVVLAGVVIYFLAGVWPE
jgi:hypothetical protein